MYIRYVPLTHPNYISLPKYFLPIPQISTPCKKKEDRRDQVSVPERQQVRMTKEAGYGNSHLQPQHLSLIVYLRPSHLTKPRVSKTVQWLKTPATNACNWNLICIWKERIKPTSCLLTY